jgi:transposase
MRDKRPSAELEHRRRLAVQRALEGYSTQEVAEFLDVDPRSVRRWVSAYRRGGAPCLLSRSSPGRPPKLTLLQGKILRRWLTDSPTEHGFDTELWTAPRLARLIHEEFDVQLNPRSLRARLRERGFTPQKPQRVPRERDPKGIAAWRESDWPRIQKKRGGKGPPSP